MGIQGLWPVLKETRENVHISDLDGTTLAVDGYGWMHRGAHACATELARGEPTTKHVRWFLRKLAKLRRHRIRAIVVFDGRALPAKSATNATRRAARDAKKLLGDQLYGEGRHEEAREAYAAAIAVTPQMVADVCAAVARHYRTADVRCIVAPYEADPQIGYLAQTGAIDGAIAEDSDLFVYDVPLLIRCFDRRRSKRSEMPGPDRAFAYRRRDIFNRRCGTTGFEGISESDFVLVCCLAGCDYADSIDGVGIKTALKYVQQHREVSPVLDALQRKYDVPADYAARLERALLTFGHQTVLDEALGTTRHLAPLSEDARARHGGAPDFLGAPLESDVAVAIGRCEIHPLTLEPFQLAAPPPLPEPASPILPRRRSRDEMEADEEDDDAYDEDDFWDEEDDEDDAAPESFLLRKRRKTAVAVVVGASAFALGAVVVGVGYAWLA